MVYFINRDLILPKTVPLVGYYHSYLSSTFSSQLDRTCLMDASLAGSDQIVEALLAAGADVDYLSEVKYGIYV